jgi:amino acid transporter
MMNIGQMFIFVSIIVLLIIAIILLIVSRKKGKKRKSLTPLASLAFALVIAGIFFGEERALGYSLIGLGVLLAILDIFGRFRNK